MQYINIAMELKLVSFTSTTCVTFTFNIFVPFCYQGNQ